MGGLVSAGSPPYLSVSPHKATENVAHADFLLHLYAQGHRWADGRSVASRVRT